jgi:hypothetical protein
MRTRVIAAYTSPDPVGYQGLGNIVAELSSPILRATSSPFWQTSTARCGSSVV